VQWVCQCLLGTVQTMLWSSLQGIQEEMRAEWEGGACFPARLPSSSMWRDSWQQRKAHVFPSPCQRSPLPWHCNGALP
jgi:hypothetical protein